MWTVGLRPASLAARAPLLDGSITALCLARGNSPSTRSRRRPERASSMVSSPSPLLEIRQSPNKGYGVYAKTDIPAFSRIVSDKPLIMISQGEDLPQIFKQYETLPAVDSIQFMQYHKENRPDREDSLSQKLSARGYPDQKIQMMVQIATVFQANAFNVEDVDNESKPVTKRAMFPTIARINHSCVPNAHTYFNPDTKTMDVHTISDCASDTEVEIAYFNPLLPKADRQARANAWQFECGCPACAGPKAVQDEHEVRRKGVVELEGAYLRTMLGEKSLKDKLPTLMEEIVRLVEEDHSLAAQLPNAYDYLGMSKVMLLADHPGPSLRIQAHDHLKASSEAEARITGESSPAAAQRLRKLRALEQQPANT